MENEKGEIGYITLVVLVFLKERIYE